jgi:hypothetical protein
MAYWFACKDHGLCQYDEGGLYDTREEAENDLPILIALARLSGLSCEYEVVEVDDEAGAEMDPGLASDPAWN